MLLGIFTIYYETGITSYELLLDRAPLGNTDSSSTLQKIL